MRAPFAANPLLSRGRRVPEPEAAERTAFARDRDRIIHSSAFRRLKHKTQVFVALEGDHYRTRLTHSLEVAQVARTLARALELDEDLAETLALAHDLGHTPFGHAGERALDKLMAPWGGFDHNSQTLRIVTQLECRHAGFDGLNLSWESLEGLIKHNGPLTDAQGNALGSWRETGVPATIVAQAEALSIPLDTYASAEAQIAAIADDIAYDAHDLDDGLRAGLFDVMDFADVPLAGDALTQMIVRHPKLDRARLIAEIVRTLMGLLVADVLAETRRRIALHQPRSADAVRALQTPLVGFSAQTVEKHKALQRFLSSSMYRTPRVLDAMERAQRVMRDLFGAYRRDGTQMPDEGPVPADEAGQALRVCDFIAGMTDIYALREHRRLFDLAPLFR